METRLRPCRNVRTIGVRPNFTDYNPEEAELIRRAEKIYYPTTFYAGLFSAMGKPTFPSYRTYTFAQDKIRQTALFQLIGLPHPKTHVFYGKRQQIGIKDCFSYPFIAKEPRGSARGRGIYLIQTDEDLENYSRGRHVCYIQQYLPIDRDIRVVVIGGRVVHAYWRVAVEGEYRSNVAKGAHIRLDRVPEKAIALALDTARMCGWDDVGLDICHFDGQYAILEANMKYGREGFRAAGIDYHAMMERMIDEGYI